MERKDIRGIVIKENDVVLIKHFREMAVYHGYPISFKVVAVKDERDGLKLVDDSGHLYSIHYGGSAVEGLEIIGNLIENPEYKEYFKHIL